MVLLRNKINHLINQMKKMLTLLAVLFVTVVSAQVDKIYKHNGETVNGHVLRVEEYTIVFKV